MSHLTLFRLTVDMIDDTDTGELNDQRGKNK